MSVNDRTGNPIYLVRFSQSHTSFREPELEALAIHAGVRLEILDYEDTSPFCVIRLSPPEPRHEPLNPDLLHHRARAFISRSILAKGVFELYATAQNYDELHAAVRSLPETTWVPYEQVCFKFTIDAYSGKRSSTQQRNIIELFSYLPLKGKIAMKSPGEEFVVFEEWEQLTVEEHAKLNSGIGAISNAVPHSNEGNQVPNGQRAVEVLLPSREPRRLFFGRYVGSTQRDLIVKHDLKKRPYISTTSMDAELALVTANLAQASPGKLFLDPFTGTGGFMVAAAELGAVVLGSDIDGRSFRGKGHGLEKGVGANFIRYGLQDRFADCVSADLTNSPFRLPGRSTLTGVRWLDGIVCDPPYGVREGLKVLGRRLPDPESLVTNGRAIHNGPYYVDGAESHTLPGFIAPKRPYSFNRMLDDILYFAACTLVNGGRLAFWMPVANDADEEFPIPQHMFMQIRHSCIQRFNKWSRRLLVYERLPGELSEARATSGIANGDDSGRGHRADELNQFRRMYFQGFQTVVPVDTAKLDHG